VPLDQATHNRLITHLHRLADHHGIALTHCRATRLARKFVARLDCDQGDDVGALWCKFLEQELPAVTARRIDHARVIRYADASGEDAAFPIWRGGERRYRAEGSDALVARNHRYSTT